MRISKRERDKSQKVSRKGAKTQRQQKEARGKKTEGRGRKRITDFGLRISERKTHLEGNEGEAGIKD